MAIWGPIVRFIGKAGGKLIGKGAVKTAAKVSFKRFGLGAILGGGGMLGLTSLLNSNFENGTLNGILDMLNPLNGVPNMILFFGVTAVVLIIVNKIRK